MLFPNTQEGEYPSLRSLLLPRMGMGRQRVRPVAGAEIAVANALGGSSGYPAHVKLHESFRSGFRVPLADIPKVPHLGIYQP